MIIRIDDYPTGVRPMLDDLTPLIEILDAFDQREMPFHLGIVPKLVESGIDQRLLAMKNLIPVMHGFNHRYPKYSQLLIKKNDPYNKHTLGAFDEFAGDNKGAILTKLKTGKLILERLFGKTISTYIPPGNLATEVCGKMLEEAGFTTYMSGNVIPNCNLRWISPDFYGWLHQMDFSRHYGVVCLHVTWEFDFIQEHGFDVFRRHLDKLKELT